MAGSVTSTLHPAAKAAARAAPGAWFAFSVEDTEGDAFVLRPTGRYAQSLPYLARVIEASGWQIRAEEALAVRTENGAPIQGHVVIAQLR